TSAEGPVEDLESALELGDLSGLRRQHFGRERIPERPVGALRQGGRPAVHANRHRFEGQGTATLLLGLALGSLFGRSRLLPRRIEVQRAKALRQRTDVLDPAELIAPASQL